MQLETTQFNDHIWYIDNGLLGAPGTGSTYVLRGDEIAIIETGASHCAPYVLDGLQRLGIKPADVRHIVLTHIHMDHAGGTGTLLPHMPDATVHIHSRTAQYLTDPAKLIESAERALGDLFPLHLPVESVPADRIQPADELRLNLGRGVVLEAVYTPGHSADHLAYYEHNSRALFSGDSLGVQMLHLNYVGPVTPPPGTNLAAQRETFRKLHAMPVDTIMFSHWGPSREAPRTMIERECAYFEEFVQLVRGQWETGHVDHAAIIQASMREQPPTPQAELIVAGWIEMSIKGLVHAFERQARKEREAAEQGHTK
jgi:glyoxylase-like metal-dependent hydrolase (beta-lactamase superfamily II)